MKKTFQLVHPKIQGKRVVESIRSDIKKYLKRENKKKLPKGSDFWRFDCRFGPNEEEAKAVHVGDLGKCLDRAENENLESCYLEILARATSRTKKVKKEAKVETERNDPKADVLLGRKGQFSDDR